MTTQAAPGWVAWFLATVLALLIHLAGFWLAKQEIELWRVPAGAPEAVPLVVELPPPSHFNRRVAPPATASPTVAAPAPAAAAAIGAAVLGPAVGGIPPPRPVASAAPPHSAKAAPVKSATPQRLVRANRAPPPAPAASAAEPPRATAPAPAATSAASSAPAKAAPVPVPRTVSLANLGDKALATTPRPGPMPAVSPATAPPAEPLSPRRAEPIITAGRPDAISVVPPSAPSAGAPPAAAVAPLGGPVAPAQADRGTPGQPIHRPALAVTRPPLGAVAPSPDPVMAPQLTPRTALPAVGPKTVAARLDGRLRGFPCSRLESRVGDDLAVRVSGRVASTRERSRLERVLGQMAPAGVATMAVEVVAPPFCTVLDVVEAAASGPEPEILLNRPDGVYREGEFVVVRIRVPEIPEPRHFHAVYVDHTGSVLHLVPNRLRSDAMVESGQTVTIGVEADERQPGIRDYEVVPPFGPGMVLVLLSRSPLRAPAAAEIEPVDTFVSALSRALAAPSSEILFSRQWIETRPAR